MKQKRKVFTELWYLNIIDTYIIWQILMPKGEIWMHKEWNFSWRFSSASVTKSTINYGLVTFTEGILNRKLHILYRVSLKSMNYGKNEQTKTKARRWNYNYHQWQRTKNIYLNSISCNSSSWNSFCKKRILVLLLK